MTTVFKKLTPFGAALSALLSKIELVKKTEFVGLQELNGRVLAEDVVSEVDLPPYDRSAVDGYAVKAKDTFGAGPASPVVLNMLGSAKIGAIPRQTVEKNGAVGIVTGGRIPEGADAVVMKEFSQLLGKKIEIVGPVPPNKNIAFKGEDIRKGETILKSGQLLRPWDVAAVAGVGKKGAVVYKKPVVGMISTGNELIPPGKKLRKSEITDVNSYSLSSAVRSLNCIPKNYGIVSDSRTKISNKIREAVKECDVVLVSGGSSVGEEDFSSIMLEKNGEQIFHGVAMQPGMPTGAFILDKKLVLSLSGFPVAALTAFIVFVKPVLEKMSGRRAVRALLSATLKTKVATTLGKTTFVRVKLTRENGKFYATPVGIKGSGTISTMVKADGILTVPENSGGFEAGSIVKVDVF